jgi:hypothetical protein
MQAMVARWAGCMTLACVSVTGNLDVCPVCVVIQPAGGTAGTALQPHR